MAIVTVNSNDAFPRNGNTYAGTFLADAPLGTAANDNGSIRFSTSLFNTDQSITISGTGLNFVRGSGGVENILGGTFRSLTYVFNDDTIVEITGLRLNAPAFFAEIRDRDATGILNLLFAGADKMTGTRGIDVLFGFGGADKLFSGAGNDILDGGAGRDVLHGDGGKDVLTGGADADRFVFDTAPARRNVDQIADFTSGEDTLVFDRSRFRGAGGANAADIFDDAFVRGTVAQDAEDRFIYHQSTGRLWFDRNGDASGGKELIVLVFPGAVLTADDIGLI